MKHIYWNLETKLQTIFPVLKCFKQQIIAVA